MLLGRNELISMLFSETDRAQRMKTPLALVAIEIDDCESNSGKSCFDEAVPQICERIGRLLRCYDTVGRMAAGRLAIVLPGCSKSNAKTLAERVRDEVFSSPLTACGTLNLNVRFGVVSSAGRSPFVVLREVENTMLEVKASEPGTIVCTTSDADTDLAAFLMPVLEHQSLR